MMMCVLLAFFFAFSLFSQNKIYGRDLRKVWYTFVRRKINRQWHKTKKEQLASSNRLSVKGKHCNMNEPILLYECIQYIDHVLNKQHASRKCHTEEEEEAAVEEEEVEEEDPPIKELLITQTITPPDPDLMTGMTPKKKPQ